MNATSLGRRKKRWSTRVATIQMWTFTVLAFGIAGQASAHQSPAGCNQNGAGASLGPAVTGVRHGDEICYTVEIFNDCLGCCDVTGLNTELILPDGSSVPILVGVDVPSGDRLNCPGDTRCATASTCTIPAEIGYRYIVNHADEHGETGTNCPPTPAPGKGEVSAFVRSTGGTVHAPIEVGATVCKPIAADVPHACCQACVGTCTDVATAADCAPPAVFTADKNCDEITCSPLACNDGKSCTNPDACDPTTGACVFPPVHAKCDDGKVCNGPDVCDPSSGDADPLTGCVITPLADCCDADDDCPPDNLLTCVDHFCNPATDLCETRPILNCNPRVGLGKGSILYYSKIELKWNAAGTLIQDTLITLVNDLNREVCVEWHFINGDPPMAAIPGLARAHPGWNSYDCGSCYTPHENVFMSMYRGGGSLGCQSFTALDPGFPPGRPDPDAVLPGDRVLRGYAIAIAVNLDGVPISHNHLTGHVDIINYRDRSAWEFNTYAFQCVAEPTPGNPCGTDPLILDLNGVEYDTAFDRLLFDFYAVHSTAFSRVSPLTGVTLNTDLTLYPVSVDFRKNSTNSDGPVLTRADIVIWNENEDDRTGTSRCITCWDQTLLSNYDAPNNFLIDLLNTNKGKARIDGVKSDSCEAPGACCCRRQCSITALDCVNSSDCPPFGAAPGIPQTCGLFNCFDPDCTVADFRRGTPDRDCSEDAALLGVSDKILTFGGALPARTDAGMTLVGIGTQSASIKMDPIPPTAPLIPAQTSGKRPLNIERTDRER